MYTVSWFTMLYDVIYVYTTFYMMYIMNTTCTMFHQTSIVTGHTNLQEKTYTYDINGTPFATLMFFGKHVFLLGLDLPILCFTSGSLFKTSWIGQRWWPWLRHENPPLMEAKAPWNKAFCPQKGKAWDLPLPPFLRTNMFVLGGVIYIYIIIYIFLYVYKNL